MELSKQHLTGLIRGATYTFDTSDSTVSSHPFRFATSDGGSEYTTGVNALTGAATTITVPHDAPDTLYYYCVHLTLEWDRSITNITTDETKADPYASNCFGAFSMSGGRYQEDSSLLNTTSTYKSVSGGGSIASGISTETNFYHTSIYFDGDDSFTVGNTSELTMGTGDFTVEFWYKAGSSFASSNFYVFDFNNNGLRVQLVNNTIAFATGSSLVQATVNGAPHKFMASYCCCSFRNYRNIIS